MLGVGMLGFFPCHPVKLRQYSNQRNRRHSFQHARGDSMVMQHLAGNIEIFDYLFESFMSTCSMHRQISKELMKRWVSYPRLRPREIKRNPFQGYRLGWNPESK